MTGPRREVADARRVVVKIGSSSITGADGRIDIGQMNALVDAISHARAAGREVVVVSSGAIAAGMEPLGLRRRPRDLAGQQAAASVGQGLLLARYTTLFEAHGHHVGQVLLTAEDVSRQRSYANAQRTFTKLLSLGIVPVVNENDTVATHEIGFGDNDRMAALVAHVVGADLLLLLSDVDGLYTDHPSRPGAERIGEVAEIDDLRVDTSRRGAAVGKGGMTTKLEAARIATHAGVTTVLALGHRRRSGARGRTRRHPVPRQRSPPVASPAVAGLRLARRRRSDPGRWRRHRRRGAQGLAAPCRCDVVHRRVLGW